MGWINYNAKYYKNGKVDIIKELRTGYKSVRMGKF